MLACNNANITLKSECVNGRDFRKRSFNPLWILYPPDVISVTETCFWKVKNDLLIYKAKVYRFDRL